MCSLTLLEAVFLLRRQSASVARSVSTEARFHAAGQRMDTATGSRRRCANSIGEVHGYAQVVVVLSALTLVLRSSSARASAPPG